MQKLTGLALVLAVVATGVAVFAVLENRSLRAELEDRNLLTASDEPMPGASPEVLDRLEQVEFDLARIENAAPEVEVADAPTLEGRVEEGGMAPPGGTDVVAEVAAEAKLKELVDDAVDKKAQRLMAKANKKPTMDVFADVLGLDEEQREVTERLVLDSQHKIREIMDMRTSDGMTLMDEFVDVFAVGIAAPEKAGEAWGRFIAKVTTETVPGSDETFAQRFDVVKDTLRGSLKRSWSEEQYQEFESWKMDPTEIADIEGNPWTDLEGKVIERAREMGAVLPDEKK